jgi:hypothetical protein
MSASIVPLQRRQQQQPQGASHPSVRILTVIISIVIIIGIRQIQFIIRNDPTDTNNRVVACYTPAWPANERTQPNAAERGSTADPTRCTVSWRRRRRRHSGE